MRGVGDYSQPMDKRTDKYAAIINMPHHVSSNRLQMPLQDRAAQFSPFAALTGYDEAIGEKARLTQERPELDESCKEIMNSRLRYIKNQRSDFTFTYFVPDEKKNGGSYRTVTGKVQKLRECEEEILLTDGTTIPFGDLIAIEGDIF